MCQSLSKLRARLFSARVTTLLAGFERWSLRAKDRERRPLQTEESKQIYRDAETTPKLSVELIECISDFLFEIGPPDDASSSLVTCTKPKWQDVDGFMQASLELHRMGWVRWMAVLTIRGPGDWEMAIRNSRWVRELKCLDGALANPHSRVLAQFERLYAVSIDGHGDVLHDGQGHFAYRDLIRVLPQSLRRFEITRAHGPDIRIIATIKQCCPELEELRLGRCTAFNNSSACDFWKSFPLDHDSYMSSDGSDSYAHSLVQELVPLRSLQTLRLGLYLIPSTTVLAHRLFHRRGLPAPDVIEWQQAIPLAQLLVPAPADAELEPATPDQLISLLHETDPETEFGPGVLCAMCIEAMERINREAEMRANAILKELVPSLVKMQWMSWLSPDHLGLNTYDLFSSE